MPALKRSKDVFMSDSMSSIVVSYKKSGILQRPIRSGPPKRCLRIQALERIIVPPKSRGKYTFGGGMGKVLLFCVTELYSGAHYESPDPRNKYLGEL
jgi:hypothetical protein